MIGRCAALSAALLAVGTEAAAQQRRNELVVTGDGVVTATVNGVPGRIRIDPAVRALPLLSPGWAQRAGLRAGPFGFGYLVGPLQVDGVTTVTRIAVGRGARALRRRVGWTARPFTDDADGVIGPGGMPQQVIRFVLRDPGPGERTTTLPLVREGGVFASWGGMYALVDVGGVPMRVRFDPNYPRTLATAGAAVRLALAHDGRIAGETESVEIAFGIRRPVRMLRLARPLAIGSLSLSSLGVRTADFGSAASIREVNPDPDEIVVTGQARRHGADRLTLGADVLNRCSSIVFDKMAWQIRLNCA
jgi:hypothetical protein